jgi:hypothetical protein
MFQEKFSNWSALPIAVAPPPSPKATKVELEPFDVKKLYKFERPGISDGYNIF